MRNMSWNNWRSARRKTSLVCRPLRDQAIRLQAGGDPALEEELNAAEAVLSSIQQEIATPSRQDGPGTELPWMSKRKMSWLLWIRNSVAREAISEEIVRKKAELEERKTGYDREQLIA